MPYGNLPLQTQGRPLSPPARRRLNRQQWRKNQLPNKKKKAHRLLMKVANILGGVEIFLLAAVPAWVQSPSGKQFLHTHIAIADTIASAYVGFRAVDMARRIQANPQSPAEPAQENQ